MLRTCLALVSVVVAATSVVGPCLAQPYNSVALVGPSGSRFGRAIASTRHRVAIGAPGDDSTGAVTLYDTRTLVRVSSKEAPGAQQYDLFGSSIAAVNGEFAVGAPGTAQIHLMTPDGRIRRTRSAPGDVVGADRPGLQFGRVIAASHGLVVTTAQIAYRADETLIRPMWYAFAADTGDLRWGRVRLRRPEWTAAADLSRPRGEGSVAAIPRCAGGVRRAVRPRGGAIVRRAASWRGLRVRTVHRAGLGARQSRAPAARRIGLAEPRIRRGVRAHVVTMAVGQPAGINVHTT